MLGEFDPYLAINIWMNIVGAIVIFFPPVYWIVNRVERDK